MVGHGGQPGENGQVSQDSQTGCQAVQQDQQVVGPGGQPGGQCELSNTKISVDARQG